MNGTWQMRGWSWCFGSWGYALRFVFRGVDHREGCALDPARAQDSPYPMCINSVVERISHDSLVQFQVFIKGSEALFMYMALMNPRPV